MPLSLLALLTPISPSAIGSVPPCCSHTTAPAQEGLWRIRGTVIVPLTRLLPAGTHRGPVYLPARPLRSRCRRCLILRARPQASTQHWVMCRASGRLVWPPAAPVSLATASLRTHESRSPTRCGSDHLKRRHSRGHSVLTVRAARPRA